MPNDLNVHVLQDYIDIFGGSFELQVKWQKENIFIAEDEEAKGAVLHYTQRPLSSDTEEQLKEAVLAKMPEVGKIILNDRREMTQEVEKMNKINLGNKFKQAMDFEIILHAKQSASIKAYTYYGIQRLEHDGTYVRALFTTNPYFATIFNGLRIIPYSRDVDDLGDKIINTVRAFAKEQSQDSPSAGRKMQFNVEKAFELTFYLEGEDVTERLHQKMNKKKEDQMTLDEFGFLSYIAFYQLFNGKLNQQVPLKEI